jgi:hypothetical protein
VVPGQTEAILVPAPELSLTEQAELTEAEDGKVESAEAPESRSAALSRLVGGVVPEPAHEATPAPATVRRSGNEQVWADGDTELTKATVLVSMFKATVAGKQKFAYKGDLIEAPTKLIDRGVSLGALSKE